MNNILKKYHFFKDIISVVPYGNGHINKTYLVSTQNQKYIFQQINHFVFKNPQKVMKNIDCVTEYLKSKIELSENKVLEIVPNKRKKLLSKYKDDYYRCYKFIEGAKTYEKIENCQMFYEVGRAIGMFQANLQDFPVNKLNITIPDFHNTIIRFKKFIDVINQDTFDRCKYCKDEIEFIWNHKEMMGEIVENKKVPVRVAHNDTKLNNVMINEETMRAVCVIDLDTIMPGSILFDYGDAIRVGANTALEDEVDLTKVSVDVSLFEAFTEGFLEEAYPILTTEEKKLLVMSAIIITLECGMRFLTDFLENDVYFKTAYPFHNLTRAKVQLRFCEELEKNSELLNAIVNKLIEEKGRINTPYNKSSSQV